MLAVSLSVLFAKLLFLLMLALSLLLHSLKVFLHFADELLKARMLKVFLLVGILTPLLVLILIRVAIEFVIVASTVSIDGPSPAKWILLALAKWVLVMTLPALAREPLEVLISFMLLLSCEWTSMSP